MFNNRKVKTLLINKPFQLSFLGTFGGFILGISLSYSIAAYLFFHKFYQIGHKLGLPEGHSFFNFLDEQQIALFQIFAITFIIVFCVFLYVGLHLSHRVAGPLHRLNNHLKEMAQRPKDEPLSDVKFRDKDYFPELQNSFNQFAQRESSTD